MLNLGILRRKLSYPMDIYSRFISVLLLLLAFGLSALVPGLLHTALAETFTVGDSQGWVVGSVNYTAWAAGKRFHVGDELLFNYLKQYHTVLVVNEASYKNCTTTKPMASYDDGKTLLTLSKPGAHYYICGVPGHCPSGQKLAVVARAPTAKPYSAPAPAPSPSLQSDSRPVNHVIGNGRILFCTFLVMLSLL